MIFHRFEDPGLAQYSYLIGSREAGRAAVVDPRRDVGAYLDFAADLGLEIAHVLETHIHADYASGAYDLAQRTGATLHLSAHDEGEAYEVTFEHEPMADGDELRLGRLRLRAVHTPGHTPEHLSFLLYDDDEDPDQPARFLTGDFLFVGSVGRPDLLGEGTKRELAGRLYDSLARLERLPDDLRIHPGHGAGSMCGSGMSGSPESTMGQELATNPWLDPSLGRDEFVESLLASLPLYPPYYLRMKERNAGGAGFGASWPQPRSLEAKAFAAELDRGVVIDLREQLAFGGGHPPDAFGIGNDPDLSTWGGWVLPPDRPLLLVADDESRLDDAVTRLARVGFDRIEVVLDGGMKSWLTSALPIRRLSQVQPDELASRLRDDDPPAVLDVRTDDEWEAGHIRGAIHIHGGRLQDRLDELPEPDAEIMVLCGSGYRSTVACSVLQREGWSRVSNVPGGMTAWRAAGLPVVTD